MKKYLLIYHREDNDGLISGALFFYHLTKNLNINKNDIQLMGADYNMLNDLPDEYIDDLPNKFESVIMTDISFNNTKRMKKLYDMYNSKFIWCDHHKAIITESFKMKFDMAPGVRDTSKSAILCAYQYLFDPFNEQYNNGQVSELLRTLSAYDSWSYERENIPFNICRAINKYITVHAELSFWNALELVENELIAPAIEHDLNRMFDKGMEYIKYDQYQSDELVRNYGDLTWTVGDNQKACALFWQGPSNSRFFETLQSTDIRQGIVFKRLPDTNWVISLYNVNDSEEFDCGKYLKETYKGGGHKGAAGCTISEKKFLKILKAKQI